MAPCRALTLPVLPRRAAAWLRTGALLALCIGAAASGRGADTPPAPNTGAACLECHTDSTLSMRKDGRKVSLFVEAKSLAQSAHASLDCADCHEKFDAEAQPHRKPMTAVDCTSCHDDVGKKHAFHPRLARKEPPKGADTSCTACHGTHAVAAVKQASFPFADGAQPAACGTCHTQARDHFTASAHGRAFIAKQAGAPDCLTCHRQPVVPQAPGKATLGQKLAQAKQCESCHVGKEAVASHALRGTQFVASFDRSVHGAALNAGKADAANCVDCHGAHEMDRAMAANARVNKLHLAGTCAQCHEKTAREFGESVHAAGLRKGNIDSASCTDCHGEHDMRSRSDPASPTHASNVAREVCANCHASLRLTRKYGLPSQSVQTFADSYHGLAVRGGSVEVVNCASCHSAHAIKPQSDPASTVNEGNLAQTCGQCHPGANIRFAVGKVHVSPEAADGKDGNSPVLYIVSTFYLILIVVVVGGMFLHNLLDFVKKTRRKLAIQKGLIEEEHVAHRLYLRMTVHERLQHAVLVISFVLLAVTGFMLRYPEAWWVVAIRNLSLHAFEWRGWIHRIAGIAMMAGGVWHVAYLAFTRPGRALFLALLPRLRDVTDPFFVLKYNLGLSPTKPEFPRFSYIEKTEYWALVWGTLLMGATGAILWFENTSIGTFTKLGFDISRTIHGYEAVLATLAILVWHFYFVIFNPDVYPMNLAWLTGRMSELEMLEEHPLELARLKSEEAARDASANPAPPQAPPPDADG